jgi:methionyl-tRNA formyltransferase
VEDRVDAISHRFLRADPRLLRADFLVSHGYMFLVGARVLARFPRRAVNLHNGLLPFNRGWDPVMWSVIEGTPGGVTIHYMDEQFDTGPIIAQREVVLGDGDTLRSGWWRHDAELVALFEQHWPAIRAGRCATRPQPPGGSRHLSTDRQRAAHLLTDGWDTSVGALARSGRHEDPLARQ